MDVLGSDPLSLKLLDSHNEEMEINRCSHSTSDIEMAYIGTAGALQYIWDGPFTVPPAALSDVKTYVLN